MGFKSLVSLAAVAMLVIAGPSNAEPNKDKDKGQGQAQAQGQGHGQGQGQGQSKGQGQGQSHDDHHYAQDDKGKGEKKMTHGQVVSECNHRANERKLKGKDRQRFVEWCTDRGERYTFDDRRYKYDEDCYKRADRKDLSGIKRTTFIAECAAKRDRDYDRERERDRDSDPPRRDGRNYDGRD